MVKTGDTLTWRRWLSIRGVTQGRMTDLSHWVFTNKFTAHQAAFLIFGVDPSKNTDGFSAAHIKERIKTAYEGALKNLRFQFFVEPSLPDSWADEYDATTLPLDPKMTLMSLEMERL